ncbi:MAG: chorismate mutase [Mycoplasmoidaceae bacterium]|nr:chorismate mutase [Mycoplasmoidaceae bacterium]
MTKLEQARKQINRVDKQIVRLFEQRMMAVEEIAKYKMANHLPILDSSREKELLMQNLSLFSSKKYAKYYKDVFAGFLKASKSMQKKLVKK